MSNVSSAIGLQGGYERPLAPGVEITRRLLGYLGDGDLQVGQRLPGERQLADDLGVGRSTIREALKILNLLGLIEIRQGDGTYLTATTSQTLPSVVEWSLLLGGRSVRSLTEARLPVEVALAGLAAVRWNDDELARMQEAFERMEEAARAGDTRLYADADTEFHLSIGAASENEILAGVLNSISSLLKTWTERVTSHGVSFDSSLELHRPILEAISARDRPAAEEAMRTHMEIAIRHLEETLQDDATRADV